VTLGSYMCLDSKTAFKECINKLIYVANFIFAIRPFKVITFRMVHNLYNFALQFTSYTTFKSTFQIIRPHESMLTSLPRKRFCEKTIFNRKKSATKCDTIHFYMEFNIIQHQNANRLLSVVINYYCELLIKNAISVNFLPINSLHGVLLWTTSYSTFKGTFLKANTH
jgi:hypothetical protein